MKLHGLKCDTKYFSQILSGTRTFELRFNDRGFAIGDVLLLKEYCLSTNVYSGKEIKAEVTDILRRFPGLVRGYVIMSIKIIF